MLMDIRYWTQSFAFARRESDWHETPMRPMGNDRWQGTFEITEFTPYLYTVQAWVDPYKTWIRDLIKKADAGQDIGLDILAGGTRHRRGRHARNRRTHKS